MMEQIYFLFAHRKCNLVILLTVNQETRVFNNGIIASFVFFHQKTMFCDYIISAEQLQLLSIQELPVSTTF